MIGRKSVVAFLNVGVGALLGLVALKVSTLYFGKNAYGEVGFAMSLLGILYLFLDLNMADAHVKRVSEGWDVHDCFKTFAMFKLVSTTAFVLIGLAVIYGYVGLLGKPLESTTLPILLVVMAYYVAKNAMLTVQSTFEAKTETARAQMANFLETVIRVTLTVVGAWLLVSLATGSGPFRDATALDNPVWRLARDDPGAVLAFAYFGGALVASLFALVLMRRVAKGRGRFRWDILRSYWTFALPLFLVSAIGVISTYIDRTALGFFGAASDAADLTAPRTITGVLEGLGAAVGIILFPTLSALAARGDHEEARRAVDRSTRYLSLLLLPLVTLMMVFPDRVLLLLTSEDFTNAGLVLVLLAAWAYIALLTRPVLNLLMGLDHPRTAARIGIAGAVANTVLALVLVPEDIKSLGIKLAGLKAVGAALALLLSGLLAYVLLLIAVWRIAGYKQRAHVWRHLLAAALMGGALWAFDRYGPLPLHHWWTFPIYGVLGLAVYVPLLLAMRELTREDLDYARHNLHPGEMAKYIRGELFDREG